MAKQSGVVNLRGVIGDVQFSQTNTGFKAGRKAKFDKNELATSAKYARTRENNTEFGAAGKGVKLVRDAFRMELQTSKDKQAERTHAERNDESSKGGYHVATGYAQCNRR